MRENLTNLKMSNRGLLCINIKSVAVLGELVLYTKQTWMLAEPSESWCDDIKELAFVTDSK